MMVAASGVGTVMMRRPRRSRGGMKGDEAEGGFAQSGFGDEVLRRGCGFAHGRRGHGREGTEFSLPLVSQAIHRLLRPYKGIATDVDPAYEWPVHV
jgi:hypothetical protein